MDDLVYLLTTGIVFLGVLVFLERLAQAWQYLADRREARRRNPRYWR